MTTEQDKHSTSGYWERHWATQAQKAENGSILNGCQDPISPFEAWIELSWQVSIEYWTRLLERLTDGRCFLECGAASGRLPAHLAARGWDCTLVDLTQEGPRLARDVLTRAGVRGKYVTGDMFHLPFADGVFDVVASNTVLYLFPDIRPPLREMVRVLKPGGVFASSVTRRQFNVQTLSDIELFLARFVRRLLTGRWRNIMRESRPPHWEEWINTLSLYDYIREAQCAGLKDVIGTGLSPFPIIRLPRSLMRLYVWLSSTLRPKWLAFNESRSPLTAWWGSQLMIYGRKA
jgi:ubiquinone/menaquinone biosynthesis C-methylase UbiE